MDLLLRNFLQSKNIKIYNKEPFEYSVTENSSIQEFQKEFERFLSLYRLLYYNENRLVTAINSNEIMLHTKVVDYLFNLYLFSKNNNLNVQQGLLADFLYTYYKTITSIDYKKNKDNYSEAIDTFQSILEKYGMKKMFFKDFEKIIYNFYKSLLEYSIENDKFIDTEIINKIFHNIKTEEYYNGLLEMALESKDNLYDIIRYDKEKEKHLDIYLEYITESFENEKTHQTTLNILFTLDKANLVDINEAKKIINYYVSIVNNMCEELRKKEVSFLNSISDIENVRKELYSLLCGLKILGAKCKNKIREMLTEILRLKRYLISDDNYVNKDMTHIKFQQEISNELIENYRKLIDNNKYLLYQIAKVNFSDYVGKALELFSEFPLQSLVTNFHIDSLQHSYIVNTGKKRNENNQFKKFYDELGAKYTQEHSELQNKLASNYYEELLNYLSKNFIAHNQFVLSILGYDLFQKVIKELKDELSYPVDNEYVIVVTNILAIESNVIKLLKIKNREICANGYENLEKLFGLYDDIKKKDGIMYLNYILYEKSGLNLRNKMFHGTLINSDLSIPLLVTFCGLIFISGLYND